MISLVGAVTIASLLMMPLGVLGQGIEIPASSQSVDTPTPSGGPDDPYDCSDIETIEQLHAIYDPSNDTSDLDADPGEETADSDQIACESKFPDQETADAPVETPTATDTPADTSAPTPEDVSTATPTPVSTVTPEPTQTPEDTSTPTPEPTESPTPTAIPEPAETPEDPTDKQPADEGC